MKFLKLLWKWSWVVTLPVLCVLLYWAGATADRYFTFGMRYNGNVSLLKAGDLEFKHLLRFGETSLNGSSNADMSLDAQVRTINLFLSEADRAQLDSHLPQSGFNYVEGGIWDGDKLRKVKLRYRGDTIYHWGGYKKSFRVKTKKTQLFEGMRAFNLVAPRTPEMLNNYLSFRLGSLLGLISPKVEVVNVNINGKNNGLYILTEQLEELTLRNHSRMPGDLYAGELISKDSYRGDAGLLFENANIWEKVSINNHYPPDSKKPLERLVEIVNTPPGEQIHSELSELLDMEAFGRFNALEILTGSVHVDSLHNWRLYYDPMRSRFAPVVWDLVGWHESFLPKKGKKARLDIISSPLHELLHHNADFLRARDRALKEFFGAGLDKKFLDEFSDLIVKMSPYVYKDPNLTPNLVVVTPRETVQALLRLRDNMENIFTDICEGYFQPADQDKYAIIGEHGPLAFSIAGRSGVEQLIFKYQRPLNEIVSGKLGFWNNGEKQTIDISGALRQQGTAITVDVPLVPRFTTEIVTMQPGKVISNRMHVDNAYYEFSFAGVSPENDLREVVAVRGLAGPVGVLKTASLDRKEFKDTFLIAKPKPVAAPLVWSGEVVIDGIKKIKDPLYVKPGTVVRFSPGASLILYNRLVAEGTARQPIRFVPRQDGQAPWGTLTLKGEMANDSRLNYCEFTGGSGLKSDLFEYTAMLSIHDVKGVDVEHSTFSDSKITDDMVHAVYSKIRFSDCRFERSLMDALDVDISEVLVERCHFIASGNDAIDLMTSKAVVIDTVVENGGDKAASVGEGSHLLAVNNIFRNNVIGVQAKDGSVAALYNMDFMSNAHAIDAYKKNWRYNNGGRVYLYKSRLVGNDKMITADKKSTIRVYDSYIDKPVESIKKRLKLADTVDGGQEQKAKTRVLKRSAKEIEFMKDFDSKYMNLVEPTRRGALISAGN